MGKRKKFEVTVDMITEDNVKYIMDAYGLTCAYRKVNKAPLESFEVWAARLLLEGSSAMHKYHIENIKKSEEAKQESTGE